jgi:hypothetical protein
VSKPNPPGVIDATYEETHDQRVSREFRQGKVTFLRGEELPENATAAQIIGYRNEEIYRAALDRIAELEAETTGPKADARREIVDLVLRVVGQGDCLTWGDHAVLRDLCRVLQEKP